MEFLEAVFRWGLVVGGLGVVIFVHELGHFLVAKKNGVRVEAFSLGFGPILIHFRRGDTDYRVSLIPLGGYVKMAGEVLGDERTGAPYELTSKSVFQRLQIFVAGALMNLLFAFPLCVAALMVGKQEPPAEVASPGVPEMLAGIKPGDVIVEADGEPVDTLTQYRMVLSSARTGSEVPVRLRRGGEELRLQVRQSGIKAHGFSTRGTMLTRVIPDSPAARADLREGDVFLAVEGSNVYTPDMIVRALEAKPGRDVLCEVRRRDPGTGDARTLQVTLSVPEKEQTRLPHDEHLIAPVVKRVMETGAAAGKLMEGDVIVRFDGREIPCMHELRETMDGAIGREVSATVRRGTETVDLKLLVQYGPEGRGALGFQYLFGQKVAHVVPGSFYDRAGLKAGDVIVEKPGVIAGLSEVFGWTKPVLDLEVLREGKPVAIKLEGSRETVGDILALGFGPPEGPIVFGPDQIFRREALAGALKAGLMEPIGLVEMTFQMLFKLARAEESLDDVSGPVGIFYVSEKVTHQGWGNFIWLLALITVNLGVFNLLPIPVLDGGHVLLLLFEKIKGAPLSERFILRFQYVGLFFLLGLILFVTSADIRRLT